MIFIPDSQEINEDNPFSDDVLKNRKQFGQSLENLINNCGNDQPLVIGLDGQWGEGKTYFLKRWCRDLENNDKKTIYLDAFQSDYIVDPFFAVISEIYGFLESIQGDNSGELKGKMEELSKKTSAVGAFVCKKTVDVVLKKISGGEIGTAEIGEIHDISSSPLMYELVSEDFKTKYSNYKEFNKDFESFKNCLKECAKLNIEITGFPIVFIIDELDRCNPTYALELLEKIKHFFSVEGIVFILSMNKAQLVNSIKNIYGIDSDANLYLQKFLTIEAIMPKSLNNQGYSSTHYSKMCNHYSNMTGLKSQFCNQNILAILKKFDFNFRDCQKTFTYFSSVNSVGYGDIFSFLLAALKVKRPDIFSKFKEDTLDYKYLIEKVIGYNKEIDEEKMSTLIAYILEIWEIPVGDQKYISDYSEAKWMRNRKNDYLNICEILDLYNI